MIAGACEAHEKSSATSSNGGTGYHVAALKSDPVSIYFHFTNKRCLPNGFKRGYYRLDHRPVEFLEAHWSESVDSFSTAAALNVIPKSLFES